MNEDDDKEMTKADHGQLSSMSASAAASAALQCPGSPNLLSSPTLMHTSTSENKNLLSSPLLMPNSVPGTTNLLSPPPLVQNSTSGSTVLFSSPPLMRSSIPESTDLLSSSLLMQSSTPEPTGVGGGLMNPDVPGAAAGLMSPGPVIRVGINELLKKHPASVKKSPCKRNLSLALVDRSAPIDEAEETLTDSTCYVPPTTDNPIAKFPPSYICGQPATTLSPSSNKCIPQKVALSSTSQSSASSPVSVPISSEMKSSPTATICNVKRFDDRAEADHDASTQDALLLLSLSTSLYEDASETDSVEDDAKQMTLDSDEIVVAGIVGTAPAASSEGHEEPDALAAKVQHRGIAIADVTSVRASCDGASPAALGQDILVYGKGHVHASVASAPRLAVPADAQDVCNAGGDGNVSISAPILCITGQETPISARCNSSRVDIVVSSFNTVVPIADDTRLAVPILKSAVATNLTTPDLGARTAAFPVSSAGHDALNLCANATTVMNLVDMAANPSTAHEMSTNVQELGSGDSVAPLPSQRKTSECTPFNYPSKTRDDTSTNDQSTQRDDAAINAHSKQREDAPTNAHSKQRDDAAINDQSKQRDDATTNDQSKQRDDAATNDQSKQRDDATTNDQSKQRDNATTNDLSKRRDDATTNDQSKQRDNATTNDLSKQPGEAATNGQSKQRDGAATNDQSKQRDNATTNDQSKQRDNATTNDESKRRDDAATNDQSKQPGKAATNDQSKQRDDAATNDQSKQRDDAATNDQSKQRDDAATNDQSKQRDDAATNDQSKQRDDAATNEQSKQTDDAATNDQSKQREDAATNDQSKQRDDAATNDQSKQRDDAATNDQSKQRDDAATNEQSKQCDDVATNEQSKQCDDVATNEQSKQRDDVATNEQSKQTDDAATNDHGKHSDEVLESDATKSIGGCLASVQNKPFNDPLSADEPEHTDIVPPSEELADWDQEKISDQCNYLSMMDNDDEFYDDVTVTEQDEKMLLGESTPKKLHLHELSCNTDDANNICDILCISKISDEETSLLSENRDTGNVLGVENSALNLKCSEVDSSETARPQSSILPGQSVNLLQKENSASDRSLISKEIIAPPISADSKEYVTPQAIDVGLINVTSQISWEKNIQASDTVSVGSISTGVDGNVTVDNSNKLNKQEPLDEIKLLRSDSNVKTVEYRSSHESRDCDVCDIGKTICTNEKETESPFNNRVEKDTKVAPCQSSDMLATVGQGKIVTSTLCSSFDNSQVDSGKLDHFPVVKAKVVESVIPLTIEIKKPSKLYVEKFKKGLVKKLPKLGRKCADKAVISESCVTGTEANIAKSAMPDDGIESCTQTSALTLNNIKVEIDDNHSEIVRKVDLPAEFRRASMTCNDSSGGTEFKQTADVSVTPKQDVIGSIHFEHLMEPDAKIKNVSVLPETSRGSRIHSFESSASENTLPLPSLIKNDSAVPNQSEAHAESLSMNCAATFDDKGIYMKSQRLTIESETSVVPQTPSLTSTTFGDANSGNPKSPSNSGSFDASFHASKTLPIKFVTSDDTSFPEPQTHHMKSATSDGASFPEPKVLPSKSATSNDSSSSELKTSMKSATSDEASFLHPKIPSANSATSDDACFPKPKIPMKSATSDDASFPEPKTLMKSATSDAASFSGPKTPLRKSATSDDASSHKPKTPMKSASSDDASFHEPKTPPIKSATLDDASIAGIKTVRMKSAPSHDASFSEPKTPPMKSATSDDASFCMPKTPPLRITNSDDVNLHHCNALLLQSATSVDSYFPATKSHSVKSDPSVSVKNIELETLNLTSAPAKNDVTTSCPKKNPTLCAAPRTDRGHAIPDKESTQTSDSEDDLLTIDENVIHSDTAEIDDDFLNNLSIKTNASFLPGLNSPVIKSSQKKKEPLSSVTTSKPGEKFKVSEVGKTSSTDCRKISLDNKSKVINDAEKKNKSLNSKKLDSNTKQDRKDPLENLKRAFTDSSTAPSKPVSQDSSSKSGSVKRNEQTSNESLHVSNKGGENISRRSLDEKLASVKESVRKDSESKKRSTSTDKKGLKLIRPKETSSQSESGKHSENVSSKKYLLVDKSTSSSSREKHGTSNLSKDLDRDSKDSSVSRHSEPQAKKSKRSYSSDKCKETERGRVKLKSSDVNEKSLRDGCLKHDEKETTHTKKNKQSAFTKSDSKQSTGKLSSVKVRTPSGKDPNNVLREESVKLGSKTTEKHRVASDATKGKKSIGMGAVKQKETSVVKPSGISEVDQINKNNDSKKEEQGFIEKGLSSNKMRSEKKIVSRQSEGDTSRKFVPVPLDDNASKTRKSDSAAEALKLLDAAAKCVLESQRESDKFPAKRCQNLESAKVCTKAVENIAPLVSIPQPLPGVDNSLEPKPSRKKDCSPALENIQPSKKQKTSPVLINTLPAIKHTVFPDIPSTQDNTAQSVSPEPPKKDPKKTPLIFSDPCSDLVITSVIGSVNLNDCSNASASSRPSSGISTSSSGDSNHSGESSVAQASASCSNSGTRNEVEELACSWCRDVWNHYILHSLFRSACAVTVKSRITFGAIYLMYHWATNEKLPDKHEAIYNLLDRADLSKNLQGKNISMLVDWITLRLKSKEQQCCDVFSLVYLTDSSISEKLKGFSTPRFHQRRASVVKADLARSTPVTQASTASVPTPNSKLPSAAAPIAVHTDPRAVVAKVATDEKETPAQASEIDCSDVVIVGTKRCQIDDVSGTRKKVKLDVPGEKCVDTPNTNVNVNVTKANSSLKHLSCQPGSEVSCSTLKRKFLLPGQQQQQQKLLVPILMGCKSANSRILLGASCAANVKKEVFTEYNSMSVDVKEVFCNMPFERHSLEYNPDLKRTVRFTTIREVIALHSLCVVPTHVDNADEARLLYRSTVQLLAARGVVLLLPDGPSLVKLNERLRKHYHRSQHVLETDIFLESRWINDVAFTKMKDWKKIPQDEMPLSAVLALFCLWKNWDHLPLIQKNFSHVPQCTSSDGYSSYVSESKPAPKNADLGQEQGMNTTSHNTTPSETESSTQCGQSTLAKSSDEPCTVTELNNQSKQPSQSYSLQASSPLKADSSKKSLLTSSSKYTDSFPIEATTSQASTTSSADHPKPRPPLREFLLEQNVDVAHHPAILKDCLRLYDKFTYYAYVMNDLAKAQQMLSRPWLAQVRLQQIQALLIESSANKENTAVEECAQTLPVCNANNSDAVVPIDIDKTTAPNRTQNHTDLAVTVQNISKPPMNTVAESEISEVSKNFKSPVEDNELVNREQIAPEKTRKSSPRDTSEFKKSTVCNPEFKGESLLSRKDGLIALSEWVTFKQNSLLHNITEMSSNKRPLPSKDLEQELIAAKKSRSSEDSTSADQLPALSKHTAVEGSKDGEECVVSGTFPGETVTNNSAPLTGSNPSAENITLTNCEKIGDSNEKGSEPAIVDKEEISDHLKTIVKHLLQLSKPNKSMIPSIIRNSFQLLGRNDVRLPNNETISRYVNSIAT